MNTLGALNQILLVVLGAWLLIFMYVLAKDLGVDFDLPKQNITTSKSTVSSKPKIDVDRIENGIHVQTGLVYAEGFDLVRGTCTSCHSAQLITQNRATREGWLQMIRWMQQTQGLWDLGVNESQILDYLSKHYAPKDVGRRKNIDVAELEWFILELEEE